MSKATPKPTYKHLLVLKTAIDNDLGYCTSSNYQLSSVHWYHMSDGRSAKDVLSFTWFSDNDCKAAIKPFYGWGWIKPVNKSATRFLTDTLDSNGQPVSVFSWYDQPYMFTNEAKQYWSDHGKDLFVKLQQDLDNRLKEVSRLVIIGAKDERKRNSADRKAGMLVRVVRETEKRLYVEMVHHADKTIYEWYFIEGHGQNHYVSKDQVWLDDVTEKKYYAIVAIEDEIVAEKKILRNERDEKIQEIRDFYNNRMVQNKAEYEDRLAMIIDNT